MPRICHFTGRHTTTGRTYTKRGKAKYLGGVGTKVTGKTKRSFKPNIRTVNALVEGSFQRIKVSTKAIRSGLLVKPMKRRYVYTKKVEQIESAPLATGSDPMVDDAN